MAGEAETKTETKVREFVPALTQIQAMLDAITAEQLAQPLPSVREPDGTLQIIGTMTDDMRRMHLVKCQLAQLQDADIDELKTFVEGVDRNTNNERADELVDSVTSRKQIYGMVSLMLQHDIANAFPQPDDSSCTGHILSDGSIGVHSMPIELVLITSFFDILAGAVHRR